MPTIQDRLNNLNTAAKRLAQLEGIAISPVPKPRGELRLGDFPPAPKADEEVILQKVILALARWAKKKMGKRYKDYLHQAEEDYLLEIAKMTNPGDMVFWHNVRRAVLEAEIKIPPKLRRRSRRKLLELTPTLLEEYGRLLPKVQQVKKIEAWTIRKLKMAELFKDCTADRIEKWCGRPRKANEVVYEALAAKYSLDIHPDTLKKYLRIAKSRRLSHFADIVSFLERTYLADPK